MLFQGRLLVALTLAALTSATAFAKDPEAVPGEYIVKMKSSKALTAQSMTTLGGMLGAQVKSTIPSGNLVVVKMPMIQTSRSVISSLSKNPMVEYVEPNFIYRAERTPNDPMYGNLWGMNNTGQADSSGQAGVAGVDIGAEAAWDIETGSSNLIVAVIDTGADYNHPDLADNMWVNVAEKNGTAGVDDDGNGFVDDIYGMNFTNSTSPTSNPMDDHGHGSHCSGTIGAKGNDGKGIVGVAWNVKIMPVKFLGGDGSGSLEGAVRAIDYATKMGAKVLSNSWGGGGFSQALLEAIQRSHAAGALFIAAAGNDSADNDSGGHYPSNYEVPNVVSVAAVDNKGNLASFSNYGRRTVHVAAPGVNIYSSLFGGRYDSWSGTSMATPHVSGMVALLMSHEPNLTNLEIKQRLVTTVKPLRGLKNKVISNGMANAYLALTNTVAPPDPNDPALWATQAVNVSTPHPYGRKVELSYEVSVPGAREIALYFEKFDTERGYDKVTLLDRAGNKIGELDGVRNDSFSDSIPGDYVKIVFKSDDSVEKYGFDITKVAYR